MRNYLCLLLIGLLTGCTPKVRQNLTSEVWNDGWKFARITDTLQNDDLAAVAADYADNTWDEVTLPHTAHLEPYVISGKQWQGICWYRKHFTAKNADCQKYIVLTLEGAMNNAEVWLNGQPVAAHKGGFLPVVINLSGKVTPGNNVVAVRLDNHDDPLTGPRPLAQLDFNTYGGLYRNARLTVGDRLHFTDPILDDNSAAGIFVTTRNANADAATLCIRAQLKNDRPEAVSCYVIHRLKYKGLPLAGAKSEEFWLNSGEQRIDSCILQLSNPHLWSPGTPNLYNLESEISYNGETVNLHSEKVGIRTVEFQNRELYVNGQKTFLRGVNRHQDYPYVGYAASDNAQRRDAVQIKEAGFDYVRLSHYPPSPAFLDACDELGLFALDAIPGWQYFNSDPQFADNVEQMTRDMIRRDRNHPCVLAWEVSLNETAMPESFIDRLCDVSRSEDPTRLTAGWCEYGYDLFLNARQHRLEHTAPTAKPLNVSEYGDWEYYAMNAGFSQDAWGDLKPEARTSRQLRESGEQRLLQQAANLQEAHNDNLHQAAFADGYWSMFDYNRGYAPDLETSGVMSYDRMPKFSYDFFRSQRPADEGAMVAIASYWDCNSSLDIRVFSNCQQVELLLNGRSLGKKTAEHSRTSDKLAYPPFSFQISTFEPGELRAIGYIDKKPVAEQSVRTPEQVVGLRLEIADEGISTGRNDLVFVRAHAVDAAGTIVHDIVGEVAFTLQEGSGAKLIGDNPTPLRAGTASILLQTPNHSTTIDLTAAHNQHITTETQKIQ